MADSPVLLSINSIEFYMRNVRLRLPFRYGKACLVAAPLLHVKLAATDSSGKEVFGTSADMLPPKWFDKSPEKSYADNIQDLLTAARLGARAYTDVTAEPVPVFLAWAAAYAQVREEAVPFGLNGLTASFGSSIIERALMDAACRLSGTDFHTMVKSNGFAIDPGAIHPALAHTNVSEGFADEPLKQVAVRHTVGLGDPIREAEVADSDRINDGIPQSLEAWVREFGVHYFKIKIQGNPDVDIARLESIAGLLAESAPLDYRLTLDGNEQFKSPGQLEEWSAAVNARPKLRELLSRVLFVEQPLERSVALSVPLTGGIHASMPPLLIDESDDSLDSFCRAAELGYRGTSVKNCKGVFQGILNKLLVDHFNGTRGGGYLLSGEDLCNQPIVPLQQDLCTLSVIGVVHAERNGHHYVGTLDHVSKQEADSVLKHHPDLYDAFGRSARLRIREGRIALGSLQCAGYGVATLPDFDALTPVSDWRFDSLGIDEA
ncbi:MAG: hypothetical protein AMXMBFR84_05520 [Candidatus Hydrogenedentota bacterium]